MKNKFVISKLIFTSAQVKSNDFIHIENQKFLGIKNYGEILIK